MASDLHGKPIECFEFSWRRRVKGPGFRWEKHQRHGWLLMGPPDATLQSYEPLVEETGLFLTFARLGDSKGDFLRFADTYGRLGTYHVYDVSEPGEPFDEWQRHHRWLRFLIEVHDECNAERPALADVVRWQGDEVTFHFPKIGTGATEPWRSQGQLSKRPLNKKGLPLFRRGDLVGPARWFLCFAIQYWFSELHYYQKSIAPRMVWSEVDSRPKLEFGPGSLLGAMICQFAAALHGGWPFKECAFCHRFFRLAPGVNRANRLTCSHTCKQYLHNHRVDRARQLHAQGHSVRQIVKELSVKPHGDRSSVKIVNSWIRAGRVSNS